MLGKIALINMPFGFHIYPSIQLGTLSTLLKAHGHEAKSFYLNLHFAHQIDLPVYEQICEKRFLVGEWLFSHLLFGHTSGNKNYVREFKNHIEDVCRSINRPLEFLLEVKTRMVPEFLQWSLNAFDWGRYDVVGFSSTFNQNVASVTLAKLIKEKYPSVKILFGGSNFESEMGQEYFRAFPWIDYAVPGEAEPVLPALMESIAHGGPTPKGVVHRVNGNIAFEENHQMFVEFDKYRPPDYGDYFDQLREINPSSHLLENPVLLYETSRGCWWGEKHHCTFCGLNAMTMKFRSRSVERVHSDIAEMSKRYDSFRFRFVDNILELKYIEDVFGKFAGENYDMQFFLEVKSNLTRQQMKLLGHGGVNVIQPGIESFSANQLLEMDKGVRPMQNILCLKWAQYYGIEVSWNILTGFPGETDDDYRRQINLLKLLIHLQPPVAVGNLWLERFSPYFTRPEHYGIKITGPGRAYAHVYDGATMDLMKIAYDFEFEPPNRISPHLPLALRQLADEWKQRHQSDNIPYLFFTKSPEFITVYDGRPAGQPVKIRYEGAEARIIPFCNESPKTLEQIQSHVQEKNGLDQKATLDAIRELGNKGILYEERDKFLTLALPHNSHL